MADDPTSYAHLTFNAPLSEARSDQLSRRLAAARPSTIVDVGCGWGEQLLRVAAEAHEARAVGIDTDRALLERGRASATARGLGDRVELREQDAASHADHADAPEVRERADDHRNRWLRGYRHGLGFAYLTLGRPG